MSLVRQVFNNTPDETAFFRLMLEREGVTDALLMIQPTLFAFPYEGPPYAVLLDVASLKPDVVLMLDTWFLMVVHYGSTIAAWRQEGYQERPEYASFRWQLSCTSHFPSSYVAAWARCCPCHIC